MRIAGIDTDGKGAIAVLDTGAQTLDVYAAPRTSTKVSGKTRNLINVNDLGYLCRELAPHVDVVYLEEQWARPGQGVVSTFSFGRWYGVWEMFAAALFAINGLPPNIKRVPGADWKPRLGLDSDKKKAVALATRLFPACQSAWKLVKHTSCAEAALLAFYGMGKEGIQVGPKFDVQPVEDPYAYSVRSQYDV